MEHHVYFWLKEDKKTAEDYAQFEGGLDDLLEIEHISTGMWGTPAATPTRPVIDSSYDYALSLKFDSIEKHNLYQEDPIHDAFVEANKDLWQKVQVMDVE